MTNFTGKYLDWNQKRIKGILDFYGHKFWLNKNILDLGCGHADLSGVLNRLGATITAVDARQEHLKIASKKYPAIKTVKFDLDNGWAFHGKTFDLILDLGLLCHLKNYETHLRTICSSTTHLVLETTVADSDDSYMNQIMPENKSIYDLSFSGAGSRPSAAAIERILKDCGMSFKRLDQARFNSGTFQYDWKEKNDGTCDFNKRRIWFAVKSNTPAQFANIKTSAEVRPNSYQPFIVPKLQNSYLDVKQANKTIRSASKLNGDLITFSAIENLKVAVCVSGHLRTFNRSYQSFKNNVLHSLDSIDYQVFVHTWETLGSPKSKHNSDYIVANTKTETKMKEIRHIIAPTEIQIESYATAAPILEELNNKARLTQKDKAGLHNGSMLSYGSMLYSLNQTKNMVELYEKSHNIKYDLIIRVRTDLLFKNKINILELYNKYVYVPQVGKYLADGMNDQFAIGAGFNMKIYLGLFDSVLNYVNFRECTLRPESFLRHHLTKNGIVVKDYPIDVAIIRPNNQITEQSVMHQSWVKR